jgi:hypothetical protein
MPTKSAPSRCTEVRRTHRAIKYPFADAVGAIGAIDGYGGRYFILVLLGGKPSVVAR